MTTDDQDRSAALEARYDRLIEGLRALIEDGRSAQPASPRGAVAGSEAYALSHLMISSADLHSARNTQLLRHADLQHTQDLATVARSVRFILGVRRAATTARARTVSDVVDKLDELKSSLREKAKTEAGSASSNQNSSFMSAQGTNQQPTSYSPSPSAQLNLVHLEGGGLAVT